MNKLWKNFKQPNICVIGGPKREEKVRGKVCRKRIFEEIAKRCFYIFDEN